MSFRYNSYNSYNKTQKYIENSNIPWYKKLVCGELSFFLSRLFFHFPIMGRIVMPIHFFSFVFSSF